MPHTTDTKAFYEAVKDTPVMKQLQERLGFRGSPGSQRSGSLLKLSKEPWTIHLPNREVGVSIHFEATDKRRFHLHIETHPYTPNLAERPDKQAELAPEIALRKRLHEVIRPALKDLLGAEIEDPSLRPNDLAANSAGCFGGNLPVDYDIQRYADFVVGIVERVTPVVDRCISEVMKPSSGQPPV